MIPYDIVVWWSEEDAVFVAEVPELPGCSAHGITESEALANIEIATALWLEVARGSRARPRATGRARARPRAAAARSGAA